MRIYVAVICSALMVINTAFAAEKRVNQSTVKRTPSVQPVATQPVKLEVFDPVIWGSFRGLKWGDDVKMLLGATLLSESKDGTALYAREQEDLKLGDVELERVIYSFYKGKFFNAVVVAKKTFQNFRSLQTNQIEWKQIADINTLLTARFGRDVGKIRNSSEPLNIYNHEGEWKSPDVAISYTPSVFFSGKVYSNGFRGQSVIDFKYLPIALDRDKDIETAKKTAETEKNAEIMKAADSLQSSNAVWVGFRGINWGADISSYPDMIVSQDYGNGLIEYTRRVDNGMSLNDVPIETILYAFYLGKFGWSTVIPIDDENRYEYELKLREVLAARYNPPKDRQRSAFYAPPSKISSFTGKKEYMVTDPVDFTHKDVLVTFAAKSHFGRRGQTKYPYTYFEVMYLPIAIQKDSDATAKRNAAEQIRKDKLRDATKSSF